MRAKKAPRSQRNTPARSRPRNTPRPRELADRELARARDIAQAELEARNTPPSSGNQRDLAAGKCPVVSIRLMPSTLRALDRVAESRSPDSVWMRPKRTALIDEAIQLLLRKEAGMRV